MFYLERAGIWVFPKRLYVSSGQRDFPYQNALIFNEITAAYLVQ